METSLPMLQEGWFNASFGVTFSRSEIFFPRKGPPEAVMVNLDTFWLLRELFKSLNIELCSLSIGIICQPYFFSVSNIFSPAATMLSLFASATVFPFFNAR